MSYITTSPEWLVNLQDVGLIMATEALISDTSPEFQAFAESIGAEWPPQDKFPGSRTYNSTKIICVRIRQKFLPEEVDAMLLQFQLPWNCAYLASSYPIVDNGEEPPTFEILRDLNKAALLNYLEPRKDFEGNDIPWDINEPISISLFSGASRII